MDRAAPLPSHIGQLIRTKFYSEKAIASGAQVPLVCRLYFGKVLRLSAFVNPNNFPIDVARYDLLWNKYSDDLYTKEEVVEGMGEMLSQIHWKFGYDARDIEFIMAGAPDSMLVRWYVIDFNQMRAFDKQSGDISQLVDAFFANDPYYPRPVPNDPLYDIFRQAYMHCCPSQHAARGVHFLQEIEARYAAGHKTE
ncbi:hypothetical protein K474DRAFT_1668355 [Panus rudis PR-1116 ss-1]|nr:hypothetical protein K474DRAFT_1668355 [Panus rudis PR-1116 ss-1]